MIELTSQKIDELLKQGRSRNGGWSNKQLACLGVSAEEKAVSGWKDRLVGAHISESKVEEFVQLKDAHLSGRVGEYRTGRYNTSRPQVAQKVFILTNAKGNTIIEAHTTFQKAEDARADLLRKRPGEDYNVWGCKVL